MDESGSRISQTLNNPKAAPVILAVGAGLWRLVEWAADIDFLLSIRDEKAALIFQFLVSYGMWILIGVSVFWFFFAKNSGERKITVGMVAAVGVTTFLWGILITAYATGSVPTVIGSWADDGKACQDAIDTSKLVSFKSKYHVVLICGLTDPTTDRLEDIRIGVSSPFNITGGPIVISANHGKEMAAAFPTTIALSPQPPPATTTESSSPSQPIQTVNLQIWHEAVLVPKGTDLSRIKRLSDVPKYGGKILRQGLFE